MTSTIQALVVTLVSSIASVAVGFGLFTASKEQLIVSAIGPIVGSIVSLVSVIDGHGKTIAAAQAKK